MRCREKYTLAYSGVTLTCGLDAYHSLDDHFDEIEKVNWRSPEFGAAVNVMPIKPPALQQELALVS